ncbi:MAG TPA: hypothetical protein VK932_23835, partial [Kofleriaceae bacterium]|nr:hypothetical protein [Kofleriaceae bacterium]
MLHPPEIERPREQEPFDPVLEGARHGLSRELALKVWERVCAEATEPTDRRELERARRRFHEVAAHVAARGERALIEIGKVTRTGIEREAAAEEAQAPVTWINDWLAARAERGVAARMAVPGRRTLIGPAQGRLDFNDYRVLGLRDVLKQLGPEHPLRIEVIAAAADQDRAITGRATHWREQLPAPSRPTVPTSRGSALWHVAERHAVTLYRRALGGGAANKHDPAVEAALKQRGTGQPLSEQLRSKLEPELGVSLSGVRIHTDAVAAQ